MYAFGCKEEMPRSKGEVSSWKSIPPPQTPFQRGSFIDVCTKWLVHEPKEVEKRATFLPSLLEGDVPFLSTKKDSRFVFTPTEVNSLPERRCLVCGFATETLILANPFAQRCYILLCQNCDLGESTKKIRIPKGL